MAVKQVEISIDGTTTIVILKTKHDRELWTQLKGQIKTMLGSPEYDSLTIVQKDIGESPRVL